MDIIIAHNIPIFLIWYHYQILIEICLIHRPLLLLILEEWKKFINKYLSLLLII
jgi:hypothetical protein